MNRFSIRRASSSPWRGSSPNPNSIRLSELKDKMDKYIDMVFDYQRQEVKPYGQAKHLKIHFSKRYTTLEKQWVSSESAAQYNDSVTTKWVDADRIKVWLHFLLDNLYVQAGDQLKQQVFVSQWAQTAHQFWRISYSRIGVGYRIHLQQLLRF